MGDRVVDVSLTGPQLIGRYELLSMIGTGGMASVHLAQLAGEAGFHRLFAIKALHPHLIEDETFLAMLLDEARLAARIHHPNVVPIIDLGSQDGLPYLVMEYVEGCPFWTLLKASNEVRPPRLILSIVLDTLSGLHAAHSMVDDDGNSMRLVHRDVTPHNILVGVNGVARLTDFGVARAELRCASTRAGQLKGKVAYMSPEQLNGAPLDGRSDIFAVGSMLWSALTGMRLFLGASDAQTMHAILTERVPQPSSVGLHPPAVFDPIILKALERDPEQRFGSAEEMEDALREVAMREGLVGSKREVGEWVKSTVGKELSMRRSRVRTITKTLTPSMTFMEPGRESSEPLAFPTWRASTAGAQAVLDVPGRGDEPRPRRLRSSLSVHFPHVPSGRFWKAALGFGVACTVFVLLWSMFGVPGPARRPVATLARVALQPSHETVPIAAPAAAAPAPPAAAAPPPAAAPAPAAPAEVASALPLQSAALPERRRRAPRASVPRNPSLPTPPAPSHVAAPEERPAPLPEPARTRVWDLDSPEEPL